MTSIKFFACCLYALSPNQRMIAEPTDLIEIYGDFEDLVGRSVGAPQSSVQPVDGR